MFSPPSQLSPSREKGIQDRVRGMVTEPKTRLTVRDYLDIPDDDKNRYELMDGRLFVLSSHSWIHQDVLGNLMLMLHNFVHSEKIGESVTGLLDVFLSEYDVLHPDLLFISNERRDIIRSDGLHGAPDLVVEVLSPGTERIDRTVKSERYAMFDVSEYWLADPVTKTITVLRARDRVFEQVGVFTEEMTVETPLLPGLQMDVSEVFDFFVPQEG